LHFDLCSGAINLTLIVVGEFNFNCSDVLVQAIQFRRAWDRNNPGLLGKQPSER
jgi:hypothetical protein